jgi:malonate transporter and related proteins
MHDTLFALLPIFVLIALGFAIRRGHLLSDAVWEGADRLTFYVFFPALLLRNLAVADLAALPSVGAVVAVAGATLVATVLVILLRQPARLTGGAFAAVLQGGIRSNVYVALAAGLALYGAEGNTIVALAIASSVPLVNVLSVIALAPKGHGIEGTVRVMLRNPLILACAAGIVLNGTVGGWSGARLPEVVDPVLSLLGRAALPIGLMSVGAGLDLAAATESGRATLVASLVKLGLLPMLTWLVFSLQGIGGPTAAVCILYAAVPTSVSAYAMTRQMGGDHKLMAGIITIETLLAMVTLPTWIAMLR